MPSPCRAVKSSPTWPPLCCLPGHLPTRPRQAAGAPGAQRLPDLPKAVCEGVGDLRKPFNVLFCSVSSKRAKPHFVHVKCLRSFCTRHTHTQHSVLENRDPFSVGLLDSGEQLCGVPLLHRPRGARGHSWSQGIAVGLGWADGAVGRDHSWADISAEGSSVLMMDVGEHDGTVSQGTLGPGDVAYWGKVGGGTLTPHPPPSVLAEGVKERLPFGLRFGGSSSQSRDSPETNAVLTGKTLTS